MAMETRAITARWDADLGQLTVWSTTQAPQILRRMLARFLALPEHAVRVVTQDIGGGFGPKAIVYSEDILVPYLARALGRPVRFVETRREHLVAVTQERDQWHEAELGLTRDGRIVALRDTFTHDCGAFVSWGVIVPLITSVSVPGPYRVPNYEVTFTAAYTNCVPVTPVRGAGRPQAVFVMERLLDLAAARLGLDRVAIRERNLIPPDAFPRLRTLHTPQLHVASNTTMYVFMNTKKAPFDRVEVRQAISMAIDRAKVAELRGELGPVRCGGGWAPPVDHAEPVRRRGLNSSSRERVIVTSES